MTFIVRDEHLPELAARGLMRRHLRGGMVIDVPIIDPIEHHDAMRYVAEREAREAVYAPKNSVGTGVATRCVCWHRADGSHTPDCPAAEVADALPPWREAIETHREYRGTDANGRRIFVEVASTTKRPPVERVEAATVRSPVAAITPETSAQPAEIVCVLDTETTGLRPEARVCEIAVAVVDLVTGRVLHRAAQLIHPGCAIPAAATNVHGITDVMVAASPGLASVWSRITAFVARHCPSLDVIAHNAPFDRGVLADDLARISILSTEWPRWRWRDSITLARQVVPGLPTYSLHDSARGPGLARSLHLAKGASHRAMGDVLTTCALMTELRKRAGKPLGEWCGAAHVWGVGTSEKPKKPKKPSLPSDRSDLFTRSRGVVA